MTNYAQIGGNWNRLLRTPQSGIRNPQSATLPPSNNYLLMLAAAIATLLAVACSQLPQEWKINCTVEPKPVESTQPHDAPTTTGTWTVAEPFLEA